MARRSAERSPTTWPWPTKSSSVRGRSRSASGAISPIRSRAASENRSPTRRSMLLDMPTDVLPLVSRINVVYLYVREMERSLAFYRDLLGIPLAGDDDWQEADLGVRFALHRWHEGVAPPSE